VNSTDQTGSQEATLLCGKVEDLLRTHVHDLESPSPEEVHRLVYELELNREELEAKNRELLDAHRRLGAYRDRYVDLYDSAPLGYVTLDEDGYVQEINLAGAKLLGTEREGLIGYPFADHVAKEDVPALLEHVRKCVSEHQEAVSELHLVAKDGRPIAVQLRSLPVAEPEMQVTLCKTAITDITEHRKMEEAVRQSQAFLQTIIDAIPDPMLVVGRDYRILLANRVAREMAGDVDPVSNCRTCYQISHHREAPCDSPVEPCPLKQVIATKAPVTVTHTHYDAQGNEVFVEISAAPVFDAAGEVACIIEACRDITQRKRTEETLERERNQLRTLLDHLPDCIYIKDTESRFVAANLAVARLMGADAPDELIGKTDRDFYPAGPATEYSADERELMRTGKPLVNKDEPHVDSAGNPRAVLTTKVPFRDSQGQIVGLVGITRDITERKQAEEQLRLAQQQLLEHQSHLREQVEAELAKAKEQLVRQSRQAVLGQISASIMHDLDQSVLHMRDAAFRLKQYLPKDQPHMAQYMAVIDRGIDASKRMLTNLAELARGREPLKQQIDLGEAVREVFDCLELGGKVHLRLELEPQPFVLAADPVQFRQVLENLVANAAEAMPEGGQIRVHARHEGEVDVVAVEDDGPGILPEHRDQLFEPLFTTKPQAAGLGLTIGRQIVERHGGSMELLAHEGPGATFHIRLPRATPS
jgi:PAS domain S-box-containing protein